MSQGEGEGLEAWKGEKARSGGERKVEGRGGWVRDVVKEREGGRGKGEWGDRSVECKR